MLGDMLAHSAPGPDRMPRAEVRRTADFLRATFGSRTFSAADAEGVQVSAFRLQSAVRAGVVVRVRRGTYYVGEADADTASMAAALAHFSRRGVPAFVGGLRGLMTWDIPTWPGTPTARPLVVVPRGASGHRGVVGGVLVRECDFDPAQLVVGPTGMPVLPPLLAGMHVVGHRGMPFSGDQFRAFAVGMVIMSGALRRQIEWESAGLERLSSHEVTELAAHDERRSALARHAAAALSVIDTSSSRRLNEVLRWADPRTESALESGSLARCVEAGIELPEPQVRVRGASGTWWRADFRLAPGVLGECDGAVKYDGEQSLWKEKQRQVDVEGAGEIVIRWMWPEMADRPATLIARIERARRQAG